MIRLAIALLFLPTLCGCAGYVSQPTASIPLVQITASHTTDGPGDGYSHLLNQASESQVIDVNGQQLLIKAKYFSALGDICINATAVSRAGKTVVYCRHEKRETWFKVRDVLANDSSEEVEN